ncbi:hypothetical protein DV515_00000570 [Chloebia gouldiae]|uniref:Uncharacterized protein n=1 Tax=Chloebia gouldiae TaxID=44316 RepID=A0A3L8T291_CHLGU|nr:hypothetical protein DV515_00000570 [Chloebia gouldiae]
MVWRLVKRSRSPLIAAGSILHNSLSHCNLRLEMPEGGRRFSEWSSVILQSRAPVQGCGNSTTITSCLLGQPILLQDLNNEGLKQRQLTQLGKGYWSQSSSLSAPQPDSGKSVNHVNHSTVERLKLSPHEHPVGTILVADGFVLMNELLCPMTPPGRAAGSGYPTACWLCPSISAKDGWEYWTAL